MYLPTTDVSSRVVTFKLFKKNIFLSRDLTHPKADAQLLTTVGTVFDNEYIMVKTLVNIWFRS